jgi:hypothetical protein
MKNYKSINNVLMNGQLQVNIPVLFLLIGMPLSFFYIPLFFDSIEGSQILVLMGAVIGFISAWSWWSYKIVKWRIWAFDNIRKEEWVELKEKAIERGLIWKDGSLFERTEIRGLAEQRKIDLINNEIERMK